MVLDKEGIETQANATFEEYGAMCMGCANAVWTGSVALKQSSIAHTQHELAQISSNAGGGDVEDATPEDAPRWVSE